MANQLIADTQPRPTLHAVTCVTAHGPSLSRITDEIDNAGPQGFKVSGWVGPSVTTWIDEVQGPSRADSDRWDSRRQDFLQTLAKGLVRSRVDGDIKGGDGPSKILPTKQAKEGGIGQEPLEACTIGSITDQHQPCPGNV